MEGEKFKVECREADENWYYLAVVVLRGDGSPDSASVTITSASQAAARRSKASPPSILISFQIPHWSRSSLIGTKVDRYEMEDC